MFAISNIILSAAMSGVLSVDSVPHNQVDSLPDINKDLNELVVVAKKDIVKSDGSKVTYDLAQDNSSKGQTLIDAIRKVPLVSVDGEDNIYLNGNSNIKIYVNGKADPMLTANYQRIFKTMPANSVTKIEVITEPGAKYDAEGTGGILNLIIEQKQRSDGYSGSLSASISNRQDYINAYGATKFKNVNIDASGTYLNSMTPQNQNSRQETQNLTDNPIKHQLREQIQKFKFNFGSANLNVSWEPNANNLFTLGSSFNLMKGRVKEMKVKNSSFYSDNTLISQSDQYFSGFLNQLSASANASYQHNFGSRNHNIILSYLFNYGKMPMHIFADNITTSISPDFNESQLDLSNPENSPEYNVIKNSTANLMNNYTREHTAQIDYTLPFGKEENQSFETGMKYISRHNSTYSFSKIGDTQSSLIPIASQDVMMDQNQNIISLYATYSGTFSKFNFRGGVRYEHTDMGMEDLNENGNKFWNSLDDVVPDASVTYLFSPASNLRLSYQMRISRPSLSQLTPYQMNVMENYVQTGNPDLTSVRRNSISLKYTNFSRIFGGNVGIEYSQADNAIENYEYWDNGVQYSTFANIGLNRSISINGFLMVNVNNKMSFNISGRIAYVDMKAQKLNLSNSGWTGNYNINWNYTGPADIKYFIFGGQNIHMINLQGYYSGWYYYGGGASRDFLKDKKLNVAISASNFLTKSTFFKSYIKTPTYNSKTVSKNDNWSVNLTVTWKFGNSDSKAKKTSKQIQNDDTSTTDKSKGGGNGISM